MVRVDLHCHTTYSPDSTIKTDNFIKISKKKNLQKIAITDHNAIEGALKLKKIAPDLIIVGEEISSKEGHIIGLFISEHIEPHRPAIEIAKDIKKQGGLVYIAHPFSSIRAGIGEKTLNEIKDYIDIIEVFNSRSFFNRENQRAKKYAEMNSLLQGVGSDSHRESHLGNTFLEMENFDTKEEFINSLKAAKQTKKKANFLAFFAPIFVKILSKLKI